MARHYGAVAAPARDNGSRRFGLAAFVAAAALFGACALLLNPAGAPGDLHVKQAPTVQTESLAVAEKNGVPSSGECTNEGDFSVGNHCVKLSGSNLDDFQESTHQDFGSPSEWCVCLHLYKSWGKGGATTAIAFCLPRALRAQSICTNLG